MAMHWAWNRRARVTGIVSVWVALTVSIAARSDEPVYVSSFFNVVAPRGADPWVFRHTDGWYYATVTTGVNVTLLRSRTISALGAGERKVVYVPPSRMKNLWAPELHRLEKAWYVYFAADDGTNANHRIYVLENPSDDPFKGTFVFRGKLSTKPDDRWAIDGTAVRIKNRMYFVWSGWEGTTNTAQNLYIAPMANPWTLDGQRVLISRPALEWEQRGGPPSVNEGPQWLVRGENQFIVYSAGASWTDHYALGLLALTQGDDPLEPTSWKKSQSPIFASANGVFGPGHCSFTKSPDGHEDWIIYHAAKRQGAGWSRLVRAQRFDWNSDGSPKFGVPCPPDAPIALPGGEPHRIRIEAETAVLTGSSRVTAHPSASGGAKVSGIQTPESSATLEVKVPASGRYSLVIRSCNGSQRRAAATHRLSVNGGETRALRYENTGWNVWSNVFLNVELKAGVNSMRITQGENSADVDCIDVIDGQSQPIGAGFARSVVDASAESNSHKPKVMGRFSKEGVNDLGSLDREGFRLYRYSENWKAYILFKPGDPGGFEDAVVADINGDGWNDIVLGGWSHRTVWAENPLGKERDPLTTPWTVHEVDSTRFSHEVCAIDLNRDGKCDIITTSGVFFQSDKPDRWAFVNIGRSGQGTCAGVLRASGQTVPVVIGLVSRDGKNQIAWFELAGRDGEPPSQRPWTVHVIDGNPGGDRANRDMTCMAFALADLNGDGRPDVIAASQGEGPDAADDSRQIGDGLVWYEAPADPHVVKWAKRTIDATVAWVHASSIQPADFDGDGHLDICYAEQDQSSQRKDGKPGRKLGIFYNSNGSGQNWKHVLLSRFPDAAAGGFNTKVGNIGRDRLPSIFTSLHGFFGDANPLVLWRNESIAQ
jgi:GH43 family beta-xylosidase